MYTTDGEKHHSPQLFPSPSPSLLALYSYYPQVDMKFLSPAAAFFFIVLTTQVAALPAPADLDKRGGK